MLVEVALFLQVFFFILIVGCNPKKKVETVYTEVLVQPDDPSSKKCVSPDEVPQPFTQSISDVYSQIELTRTNSGRLSGSPRCE